MNRLALFTVACLAMGLCACEDDPVSGAATAGGSASSKASSSTSRGKRKGKAAAEPAATAPFDAGLPPIDFQELEFGESERSRDPFRPYGEAIGEETRSQFKSQRDVVLSEYGLDELKLSAIVLGANPSRAMLVDPKGKGHIVHRGQFVGRPETVQVEGKTAPAYEVNWRIDQIREGDVVFVRADPNNPDVPSATKVVTLHSEEENRALE